MPRGTRTDDGPHSNSPNWTLCRAMAAGETQTANACAFGARNGRAVRHSRAGQDKPLQRFADLAGQHEVSRPEAASSPGVEVVQDPIPVTALCWFCIWLGVTAFGGPDVGRNQSGHITLAVLRLTKRGQVLDIARYSHQGHVGPVAKLLFLIFPDRRRLGCVERGRGGGGGGGVAARPINNPLRLALVVDRKLSTLPTTTTTHTHTHMGAKFPAWAACGNSTCEKGGRDHTCILTKKLHY